MLQAVQIIAILLVAIALAPALAHAFEFPGKRRLSRDMYLAVQTIYYPGFTLLGMAEPGSVIAVTTLLLLTQPGTLRFWLTAVALFGVVGMQLVYWIFTHPVNRYWLQTGSVGLGNTSGAFFGVNPTSVPAGDVGAHEADWMKFRDRWESSHVVRAVLSFVSFVALIFTVFAPR